MLMGDKYLAWERPEGVLYARKVLKHKMKYCAAQSAPEGFSGFVMS